MSVVELLMPAIRWEPERGFHGQRPLVERGLELGVGGFILFGGPQEDVRALTKELRTRSRTPLLIGADLERGAGQQFDGATGLPPLAALGWLGDTEAIGRAAKLTAREARTLGVNWDYAPVCDLDIEPDNPIIGTRSLGGEPAAVARMATAWIEACQREGVLACAKHFPGHGRTKTDSHATLPVVKATRQELYEQDLAPFQAAIGAGVASIMTAHVAFPSLDPSGVPATLSSDILRRLLRDRLRFGGLVVTDALIMQGAIGKHGERDAAVRALRAGCDVLLYPTDLEAVAAAIEEALSTGELDEQWIHESRRRRLKWAQWAAPPTDYRRASGADVDWASRLCERVVHVARGTPPPVASPVEVVVVDDDLGGPYPAPSREPFLATLREEGFEARRVDAPTTASRTPLVIALFGDIRSWKGRPGYSAASRDKVRRVCQTAKKQGREALIVQFSHPRLAANLPGDVPVLCAWGGERAMQIAAARRLKG